MMDYKEKTEYWQERLIKATCEMERELARFMIRLYEYRMNLQDAGY